MSAVRRYVVARFILFPLVFSSCFARLANAAVFPIATNGTNVELPGGAGFDGTNYLIGYVSATNVGAQLVAPSGTLLGSFIQVGQGSNGPALAFDGSNYLAVWSDNFAAPNVDLFAQFITRGGAKSGAAFPLLTNLNGHGLQQIQALAFDGTNYLAVWQDATSSFLYGQFLSRAGVVGPEFLISTRKCGRAPALGFDGTNYLLVFQSQNTTLNAPWNAFAQFISRSGTLGLFLQINFTTSFADNGMSMDFDGTNYLAVWNHNSGGLFMPVLWNIYGRTITPAGALPGAELMLVVNQNSQFFPAIAFDGANYLLSWNEGAGTTSSQIQFRFFNPAGQATGSQFNVFAAQGTNVPTFGGMIFDGTRIMVGAVLGAINTNNFQFTAGDIYAAAVPRSTAAPVLDSLPPQTNGAFRLRLTGTPGLSYSISYTTNPLQANPVWTALATNSPTNGFFDYTDLAASNKSRLYRAQKQ